MKKEALKTIQTVLLLISLVLIIIIPVRVGRAAPEASIEVTTTEDDFGSDLAYCSLREAVQAVFVAGNFGGCINPGGATAIHLPTSTLPYTLSIPGPGEWNNATGDINIRNSLTIAGDNAGANPVVSGGGIDRILSVAGDITVTVNNADFENGASTVTNGGAIYNAGTLTLNRVEISNNSTLGLGGGIYTSYDGSIPSSLILNNSSIHDNSATASGGKGGGIYNDSGSVDLDSSEIGNNDAYSDGGGLWSTGGYWITFVDSQIHHNTSQHGSGGNIFNRGPMTIEKTYINYGSANVDGGNIYSGVAGPGGSVLEITRSVISHGTAGGNGGGIANDGIMDLTNVSFYWNISPTGAGLYTSEPVSTIALDHVTMSGNLTGLLGAYNIYNSAPANPVLVNNSILEAGISTGCIGAVALASSYNIDSGTSCGLPGGLHNQSGIDPLLGIFADHGGITDTFSLSINSPAVDWIPVGVNGCGTTISEDQRGVIRPLDGNRDGTNGCDVGAYELQFMLYLPAIMK